VIFPDADQSLSVRVYHGVGVAKCSLRGDGLWCSAGFLHVESLIFEVREVNSAVGDGEIAAAVLVHGRASVERRWCDVADRSVGAALDDDVAAAFGGARFQPIDIFSIEDDLHQAHRAAGDQICGNRRLP
jgi:hypothetical protein